MQQGASNYYLLKREGSLSVAEHDYEEPYFEPASGEEGLLQQLKRMAVTNENDSELQ